LLKTQPNHHPDKLFSPQQQLNPTEVIRVAEDGAAPKRPPPGFLILKAVFLNPVL
jgi:hypothetical protein